MGESAEVNNRSEEPREKDISREKDIIPYRSCNERNE